MKENNNNAEDLTDKSLFSLNSDFINTICPTVTATVNCNSQTVNLQYTLQHDNKLQTKQTVTFQLNFLKLRNNFISIQQYERTEIQTRSQNKTIPSSKASRFCTTAPNILHIIKNQNK